MPTLMNPITRRVEPLLNRLVALRLRAAHDDLARSLDIPSHVTARERLKLRQLATGRRHIVEIGSYLGASAAAFALAKRAVGSIIYCIDTWENDAMSEGQRSTETAFKENLAGHLDQVVMLKGRSRDQFVALAPRVSQVDLLFIDADHSYAAVLEDWRLYGRLLRPGSIVAFHDYGWADGVRRVVHEEVRSKVRDSSHLPNLWWGTIA